MRLSREKYRHYFRRSTIKAFACSEIISRNCGFSVNGKYKSKIMAWKIGS